MATTKSSDDRAAGWLYGLGQTKREYSLASANVDGVWLHGEIHGTCRCARCDCPSHARPTGSTKTAIERVGCRPGRVQSRQRSEALDSGWMNGRVPATGGLPEQVVHPARPGTAAVHGWRQGKKQPTDRPTDCLAWQLGAACLADDGCILETSTPDQPTDPKIVLYRRCYLIDLVRCLVLVSEWGHPSTVPATGLKEKGKGGRGGEGGRGATRAKGWSKANRAMGALELGVSPGRRGSRGWAQASMGPDPGGGRTGLRSQSLFGSIVVTIAACSPGPGAYSHSSSPLSVQSWSPALVTDLPSRPAPSDQRSGSDDIHHPCLSLSSSFTSIPPSRAPGYLDV